MRTYDPGIFQTKPYNPGADDATAADMPEMYMNFIGWGPCQSMFDALSGHVCERFRRVHCMRPIWNLLVKGVEVELSCTACSVTTSKLHQQKILQAVKRW